MTIEEEMQTYAIGAANKARAEGMDMLDKLYSKLMQEGRMEDLRKALSNVAYRDLLLKEELGV